MSLKQLVVILALLTTGRAAVAQPGQSDPASGAPVAVQPPPPSAVPPPPPPPDQRSPGLGVTFAVVGSILPAVAFSVGWSLDDSKTGAQVIAGSILAGLVLPSLGMYYGGKKKTIGQYPRAAAVLTLALGALIDGLGDGNKEAGTWYSITAALYGLGAGIDIVMTPGAVRDWNARQARPTMAIAPVAFPNGGVGVAFGGAL